MLKNKEFLIYRWGVMLICLLGAFGCCANIYKIINVGFDVAHWGGMEVARVIGVFIVPLGAVLGYF